MVDGATGHILTITGTIYQSDGQDIYFVFDDLEAARLFIKGKQNDNDTLEFNVYKSDYQFLECWDATRWKQ